MKQSSNHTLANKSVRSVLSKWLLKIVDIGASGVTVCLPAFTNTKLYCWLTKAAGCKKLANRVLRSILWPSAQCICVFVDTSLMFPSSYPSGCLLGCVCVADCLSQADYHDQARFVWYYFLPISICCFFVLFFCFFFLQHFFSVSLSALMAEWQEVLLGCKKLHQQSPKFLFGDLWGPSKPGVISGKIGRLNKQEAQLMLTNPCDWTVGLHSK